MSSQMSSTAHPLPAPPGQHQRPHQHRARTKSTFSFRSNHSSDNGNAHNLSLVETHEEKETRRLHSKADPSMAITEAEPSAVANQAQTSLAPIRAIQHRDSQGNPIVEPDRSNPTRSRWERPLDTIRAFEAAIDGGYSRKSYTRRDTADTPATRRSSYYGNGNQGPVDDRARYQQNGYYGARSQSQRPDSTLMGRPDSYYNPMDNGGPSNGYYPNRARYPRTATEPQYGHSHGVYPGPGNQPSYETVTTASGSGSSSEPAGYSTDPSSDNSSLDRIAAVAMKEPSENYGLDGFGGNPQYALPGNSLEQYMSHQGAARQGDGYMNQGPPPPPQKGGGGSTMLRKPIKLGATSGNAGPAMPAPAPVNEKRKSWFGRRFSKAT